MLHLYNINLFSLSHKPLRILNDTATKKPVLSMPMITGDYMFLFNLSVSPLKNVDLNLWHM